jgi:DNA segregation ATPase FtsK/SpoIIIE, S-DNA-T family
LLKRMAKALKKHPFKERVVENRLESLQQALSPEKRAEEFMIDTPPLLEVQEVIEEVVEETPPAKPKQLPLVEKVVYPKKTKGKYRLPPLSLLTNSKKVDKPSLKRELRRQAEILEETLASFGIEAKVGQVNCGPTITSFDVHPAIGVKVQKIKALEDDIALNMQARSIRIIAPIPGKAAVGVEVPSLYPQEVGLKEMLSRYQQQHRKFQIPVLMGKTVTGDDVMCDLTKMPHCIIAGATGSGKSVCINTIVISILMNASPEDVKLLLVDPKKVELSGYSRLPHMIAPVITEAHGALAALNWLVKEMQYRYEIFKQLGVRNITAFNSRTINKEMEEALETPIPEKMPYFVAIIDEFADLMMASSTDLETPIARIAQMARAVGIHLILATQRPSREVITGLIKANFPTRVSFKVSSRVNSQIILDENGAETLLGNGDLLFMPPGSSQLIRAQGVYVSDMDINRIVDFACSQAGTDYLIPSFDAMSQEDPLLDLGADPKDEMYNRAYQIVTSTKTASTTYLQRKLKIGYARSASLMDELEERGVIGPQDGSRPRKVLID